MSYADADREQVQTIESLNLVLPNKKDVLQDL